jgi:hypothetical protein
MQLSFNLALSFAMACAPVAEACAQNAKSTVMTRPYDQRPGAVTRPANEADRAWRRGRRSPEIVTSQQPIVRSPEPLRFDRNGQRANIPGRPDTYDDFGRARRYAPRPPIVQSGPTVQTDAATRINQFPPR